MFYWIKNIFVTLQLHSNSSRGGDVTLRHYQCWYASRQWRSCGSGDDRASIRAVYMLSLICILIVVITLPRLVADKFTHMLHEAGDCCRRELFFIHITTDSEIVGMALSLWTWTRRGSFFAGIRFTRLILIESTIHKSGGVLLVY